MKMTSVSINVAFYKYKNKNTIIINININQSIIDWNPKLLDLNRKNLLYEIFLPITRTELTLVMLFFHKLFSF